MIRKRSSLHLLIDSERQSVASEGGGGIFNGVGGMGGVGGGGGFYISEDDDDEDDEEGVFGGGRARRRSDRNRYRRFGSGGGGGGRVGAAGAYLSGAGSNRWHRRDSYGNPVSFQRVSFYEEPGILMIIQSIGVPQQEQKGWRGKRFKSLKQGRNWWGGWGIS